MSINWEKTAKYHNKSINELKVYFEKYPQSNKKVFVICDECKKEWKVYYQKYKDHGLCASCIKKGENSPIYKNSVGNEYLIGDPKNNKKIVVLEEIGQDKYGQKIVLVKCPYCENKFEVLEKSLKNGSTKSCNHCLEKTEIGKIKNGIKLLKFEYRDKNSKMYFKAKCHCGNIFIVNYNNWKKDYTKSCGCLHLTENTDIELIMQKELEKRNYNFKTQFKILTYSADILLIIIIL